ncbi:hypothetical protein ASE71_33025 [Ensifer sp. Root954]|nr:hypothetical protein ASE71_33025 [Ensifer sp. Root954]
MRFRAKLLTDMGVHFNLLRRLGQQAKRGNLLVTLITFRIRSAPGTAWTVPRGFVLERRWALFVNR